MKKTKGVFFVFTYMCTVAYLLSVPLLWHSMGQIIKSLLSFCLSDCKHSSAAILIRSW